jgi:hypothetical protein
MASHDLLAPDNSGAPLRVADPNATGEDLLAGGNPRHDQAELFGEDSASTPGVPYESAAEQTYAYLPHEMPPGFVHPNQFEDDHYIPDYPEGLTEEATAIPSPIPGVEARKPSVLLTPLEREAALKRLLQEELEANADSGPIILEFGPLASLEKRLRGITADFAGGPDIAEVVTTRVRRCIHDAVVSNTLLGEKECTESGLMARMEAVSDMQDAIEQKIEPLLSHIEELGIDLNPLRTGLNNTLEVEARRLESMSKSLVPATLGHHIFEGLSDFKDTLLSGLTGKQELVGDVRRHRNEQLSRNLADLVEVSYELRANAGDEEWERSHGAMAFKAANELTAGIQSLTKGVEDQVDFSVLNKGLGDAKRNLSEAAEAAADAEHKNRLQRMVELIRAAVESIAKAVKSVFGREDGPKPAAMTP